MNGTLKPIPTWYKGIKYRSRTEARWAILFSKIGLLAHYEPEAYALTPTLAYLPDFYLPLQETFVEIKGGDPDEYLDLVSHQKAVLLAAQSGKTVIVVKGAVGYAHTAHRFTSMFPGEYLATNFCDALGTPHMRGVFREAEQYVMRYQFWKGSDDGGNGESVCEDSGGGAPGEGSPRGKSDHLSDAVE